MTKKLKIISMFLMLAMILAGCSWFKKAETPAPSVVENKIAEQEQEVKNEEVKQEVKEAEKTDITKQLVFKEFGGYDYDNYNNHEKCFDATSPTNPMIIGGKIAFKAAINKKGFIIYDGQEVGKEYDNVYCLIEVNNKLTFLATKDSKQFIVYDGQEIGDKYDDISNLKEINNKVAFTVIDKTKFKFFIIYGDQEVGKEYDSAFEPIGINGKLAFIVAKDEKMFLVYDGQKISKEYDMAVSPVVIDDKIAFSGSKDEKFFIVYDDKEIGKEYDYISIPININNKLAYIATKNDETFVFYDGKEYHDIMISRNDKGANLININNKIAYIATKNDKTFVVYDGQEVGKNYDNIVTNNQKGIYGVNNKLAYVGMKDKKWFLIYDGKEINKEEYRWIGFVSDIEGKIVFVANKDDKDFIVYDGQKIGKEYHNISDFTVLDNNIVFTTIKDGKIFVVVGSFDESSVVSDIEVSEQIKVELGKNDNVDFSAISIEDLSRIPLTDSNLLLGEIDTDQDGLSDTIEETLGTDKTKADTDGDTYSDKVEILGDYNPLGLGKLNIDLDFANSQKGKTLIQDNKYAWYVNPNDGKRYFLGLKEGAEEMKKVLGF